MARIIEISLDDETELKLSAAADEMNQTITSLVESTAKELANDLFNKTKIPKVRKIINGNMSFDNQNRSLSTRYCVYLHSANKFMNVDNSNLKLDTAEKALNFRDECRADFSDAGLEFEACEISVTTIERKNNNFNDGCTPPPRTAATIKGMADAAAKPSPPLTKKRPDFDGMMQRLSEARAALVNIKQRLSPAATAGA